MDSSRGSSMGSMGSFDSRGFASPVSVDSSRLLGTEGTKVIDSSLKNGGSLGSHIGKRVTYAMNNPQANKSSVDFRSQLTIEIRNSNNNSNNNNDDGEGKDERTVSFLP